MGQSSSSDTDDDDDAVKRFDIFGNLPPELQVQVCRWIIVGGHDGMDTIGRMFDVNQKWFHMMDSMPYPKSVPGCGKFREYIVESDCIRTEIQRIQRNLHRDRPKFDAGAEDALVAATEMYTTHIMSIACKFKEDHHTLNTHHLRSALMADTGQSPAMTESVYGPNSAEERQKRRMILIDSIPIPKELIAPENLPYPRDVLVDAKRRFDLGSD